ncbi:MAG: Eco57I restriction-modification methylase domain-containing protein, partial [Candidatus Asgardarchaeia archaeon]
MLDINFERFRRHIEKSCYIDDSIHNIHTPYGLCRDVISKLEENIDLTNKNINILVLFNLEFVLTLMEDYGVNEENIIFLSDSRMRNVVAERMGVKTEYLEDFESIKEGKNIMGKQFDVVIGNPPYQRKSSVKNKKTQAIWPYFVELSLRCCKENGYTSLIHPSGWRGASAAFEKTGDLLKSKQMKYLEIHDEKDGVKTFDAETRYDWYVL